MLHTSPSDERGWLGLGTCHERAGELNTAVRLYEVARHACPGSVRARLALARVLRRVDREDEARSAYEAAGELADEADDLQLASSIAHEARLS